MAQYTSGPTPPFPFPTTITAAGSNTSQARSKAARILAGALSQAFDASDSLFGPWGGVEPRASGVGGEGVPVLVDAQGEMMVNRKGMDKVGALAGSGVGGRFISKEEDVQSVMGYFKSPILPLASAFIAPSVLHRTTRIIPPPPLRTATEDVEKAAPLYYHTERAVPAPWCVHVPEADGGPVKDGVGADTTQLPETRLVPTWDWSTKNFEGPLSTRRGRGIPGSVEVASGAQGESATRRAAIHPDSLVDSPAEGVTTVHDILLYAARTHGTKDAVGWRNIENIVEEQKDVTKTVGGKQVTEKKTWKYFQLSDYQYWSFVQFRDYAMEAARGLVVLGVEKGKVFNVYAQTSVNWQLIGHACAAIGTPIATAYDTLGESGLQHSLAEPECQGVFTNADLLPTLTKVLARTPSVRLVVYDGEAKDAVLDSIRGAREGITLIHIDDVRAKGRENPEVDTKSRLPAAEDTACIMYTSGSTGAPKGVVLSHANLIASLGAIKTLLGHHLKPDDMFLAYLPLAHILEYIVELALFYVGMTTGYGRVKTLTDQSVRNCLGDIRAFRPTIMVGVPAVWETIRKGIMGKVNQTGGIKKSVFMGSLSIKKAGVPGLSQAVDAIVLSQVKAQTGGRLRLALSGGAALSRETQEFLSLALVTVLQG
ncbi:long-chain fatty acid-CoA ligase, partial [Ceratobasidium sp. 392]